VASTVSNGTSNPLSRLARLARRPLEKFLHIEAASGIVLLAAAALAMIWANSPWSASYHSVWTASFDTHLAGHTFAVTPAWVINDGMMTIFFFVVGMEIRREIHHGELSTLKRAALPVAGAIGGMVVPAVIYVAVVHDSVGVHGWGIPMATDIAFAVGILALLGKRVPPALRVLLLALAVIDDLGAIVVIAIFYSAGIAWWGLIIAATAVGCIIAMQRRGIHVKLAYLAPAIAVWAGLYSAGIHPSIAGVIVGVVTPVIFRGQSPSQTLIERLHPWVAFGVMPLFALANAGISLGGSSSSASKVSIALGVGLGLSVGKPLGVLAASGLALKLGIAVRPAGLSIRHFVVLGIVAGVGFTMSLFIAQLAFPSSQLLLDAKLGILLASAASATVAIVVARLVLPGVPVHGAASSVEEAESSTVK
jgi:Na+:H+ antiporter, NhaA family